MELNGRVATWLELAAAPMRGGHPPRIIVHPMGGRRNGCYALSVDGRWLCATDGQLTAFRGFEAAARFLRSAHVDTFEHGDAAPEGLRCDGHHFGLCMDRNGGLMGCRESGLTPEFDA